MMEAHRMETYLKNFKTYTMTIEQKDPLVEQLRHCKFFHYIGKDHNMQLLTDTELNELDERLKKKKALLDKIMNEDPTLLNEMVIYKKYILNLIISLFIMFCFNDISI